MDHRAGLLVGHGGEQESGGKPLVYSFVHRTFQEYLAGCYLVGLRERGRSYLERLREGDYWYLALQLGAEQLLYVRRSEPEVSDLAYLLCPTAKPVTANHWRGSVLSGHLASLLGRAWLAEDKEVQDGGLVYYERVRQRLTSALSVKELGAVERAEAGRHLAHLGDARAEIMDVDAMPFCYVPEGEFWLGDEQGDDSEKPARQVTLRAYWLGQYPVSQAQYGQFVAAGGYGQAAYWTEAAEKKYWREDGRFKDWRDNEWRSAPYDFGLPYTLPNHPVVDVTWYEMVAFCRWLTARWQGAGKLPAGWQVRLPAEPEWEKAAKGGLEIVSAPLVRPMGEGELQPAVTLTTNPASQRPYPWGDRLTPDIANYKESGIQSSSALGCFPENESPYGCREMSGNVWEWTLSKYDKYPYTAQGREAVDSSNDHRVLRGGPYWKDASSLRCAFRVGYYPYYRSGGLGFFAFPPPKRNLGVDTLILSEKIALPS